MARNDQGNSDIWVHSLTGEEGFRLTFSDALDDRPTWSPDGNIVVFRSDRDKKQLNLFWKRADGAGQVEQLTQTPRTQVAQSWSGDGKHLVISQSNSIGTGWDIIVLDFEMGGDSMQPILATPFDEYRPAISPDGQWMAYTSNQTGQQEVFVQSFPDAAHGTWLVSNGGGFSPVWRPDGKELFYRSGQYGQKMMVLTVDGAGSFTSTARVLFTGNYLYGAGRNYDVSADGKRFLLVKEDDPAALSMHDELIVVLNWFEELKRMVPEGK